MKVSLFLFASVIILTLVPSLAWSVDSTKKAARDIDIIHRKAFKVCKAEKAASNLVEAYQAIPRAVNVCKVTYNQIPSAPNLERVLEGWDKFSGESHAYLNAFEGKSFEEVMQAEPERFAYHANNCEFHHSKFQEGKSFDQYQRALKASSMDSKNANNKRILDEAGNSLAYFKDTAVPQLLTACKAMVAKTKCINEYLKFNAPSYAPARDSHSPAGSGVGR